MLLNQKGITNTSNYMITNFARLYSVTACRVAASLNLVTSSAFISLSAQSGYGRLIPAWQMAIAVS